MQARPKSGIHECRTRLSSFKRGFSKAIARHRRRPFFIFFCNVQLDENSKEPIGWQGTEIPYPHSMNVPLRTRNKYTLLCKSESSEVFHISFSERKGTGFSSPAAVHQGQGWSSIFAGIAWVEGWCRMHVPGSSAAGNWMPLYTGNLFREFKCHCEWNWWLRSPVPYAFIAVIYGMYKVSRK